MGEADRRRWEALPVILVATFMGLFDVFVVNVAAPNMQLDLIGVLGVSGSLALALVPLTLGRSEGWPWWLIAPLCAAPLVLVLAARYEAALARRGLERRFNR